MSDLAPTDADLDGFPPVDQDYSEDYPDDWEEDQTCQPADYEFVVLILREGVAEPVFVVQQQSLGTTNDRVCFLPFLPRGPTGWYDGLEGHAYTYRPSANPASSVKEMRAAARECRAALLARGLKENITIETILKEDGEYEVFTGCRRE